MGEKILVLQSAPARRVEQAIETLAGRGEGAGPEITVFCRRDQATVRKLERHAAVKRVWVRAGSWNPAADLARIQQENFATAVVFFTGERGYWKMKWFPFLCRIKTVLVFTGDGHSFRFGLKEYLRFLVRRTRQRRPLDFERFQDLPAEPENDRVLVLQSAPALRVERALGIIAERKLFHNPEVTLFGRAEELARVDFTAHAEIKRSLAHKRGDGVRTHLRVMRRKRFDAAVVFFTGERGYWKIKCLALFSGARRLLVFNENFDGFYLTVPTFLRFLAYRIQHGLPRVVDGRAADGPSEKVLVIQSAEPEIIDRGLKVIEEKKLFHRPRLTIFIRDREEALRYAAGNPNISRVITHNETRQALAHLRQMRRERYDTAVLFLTGDPSYWKVKYFAFLCGARHLLVVNENLDCFFATPGALWRFLGRRLGQQLKARGPSASLSRLVLIKLLRFVLFPFRFVYLLAYAARLRLKKRLSA